MSVQTHGHSKCCVVNPQRLSREVVKDEAASALRSLGEGTQPGGVGGNQGGLPGVCPEGCGFDQMKRAGVGKRDPALEGA